MPITCHDLLKLNSFRNIKLIAGESGLYRTVIWPYTGTTSSVSQWLHGGELLFITGAGLDVSKKGLESLLQECLEKHLAGLVVITGDKYISSIPDSLIEYANKNAFPIFSMPWKLRLIDVTREIISAITASDDFNRKLSAFTEMLVFSKEPDETPLRELAGLYGVEIRKLNFLFSITIKKHSDKSKNSSIVPALNDILKTIETLYQKQYSIAPMYYANQVLFFCSVKDYKEREEVFNLISATFQLLASRYSEEHLSLAFGSCYMSLKDIRKSWKELLFVNKYISYFSPPNNIASFDNLGIYKLLYQFHTPEERKRFYLPFIQKILEHDEKNASELLATLKCFIENNGNLIKTADALFIHRNTLIYRINIIKKLLENPLEDIDIRISLYISIIFYEFDLKDAL